MAGQLIDTWLAAVDTALAKMFDPAYDNWLNLLHMIDEGAMLMDAPNEKQHNATSQAHFRAALWATLIPWAWSLSNDEHHPFIM